MIVTAYKGTNAELIEAVCSLYLVDGMVVADVTYGEGAFWRSVDIDRYDFRPTDLKLDGTDFRNLPYEDGELDVLVLDPPYTPSHDRDLKASVASPYGLDLESAPRSTPSVVALYAGGIAEAGRCLKRGGLLLVKCQDAVENHRRHWTHVRVMEIAEGFGFDTIDQFVLLQDGKPTARQKTQKRARSNHSFLWVFQRRGFPW